MRNLRLNLRYLSFFVQYIMISLKNKSINRRDIAVVADTALNNNLT